MSGSVIKKEGGVRLTICNLPALIVAAELVGFSYTSARFQYAPARQAKAQTRVRKMIMKTMLVRREQMRKIRQTSLHIPTHRTRQHCPVKPPPQNPPAKEKKVLAP